MPHVAPKKYFDLYDPKTVSLAPNRLVPSGFKEENFHADGTFELISYNLNAGPQFKEDGQDFHTPLDQEFSRLQRRGYFAATSFTDANIGRMLAALENYGYKENTIVRTLVSSTMTACFYSNLYTAQTLTFHWRQVLLWGDHGWRELYSRSLEPASLVCA